LRSRLASSILAAFALGSGAAPAWAQNTYERAPGELPPVADGSASLILVAPKPGAVRWGLDGWTLPDPALRPPGTAAVDRGAVETPLEGPCPDGLYRTVLGPFTGTSAPPRELDFVLHFADGSWDSNGGKNYRLPLAAPGQAPVRRRPITIGRGPWLGSLASVDQFEDLLDWELADCRGVDPAGDERRLSDGLDDSRDLVAFYARRESGTLFLRVDVLDLALGAETQGGVVLGFLVSWGAPGQTDLPNFAAMKTSKPWNLALVVRDSAHFQAFDGRWNALASNGNDPRGWFRGASYRSDLDAVELGLSEDALRAAGWDGTTALRFQVYSQKDGDPRVTDAFQEVSLDDGSLDQDVGESDQGGTAKLATILHGNQMIQQPGDVRALITSANVVTPSGRPTGYHRALDAHVLYRVPVNLHVSGTLASALEWAAPSFNDRIRGLVSGKLWRGRGALVGGVLSEHILPYFETQSAGGGEGPSVAGARLNDRLLAGIYGVAKPRVFWTPERVIRGSTFDDVKEAGYAFTVLDQVTHIRDWFGAVDASSTNGHKLNRISDVSCFLINDAEDQWKFANTDEGLWLDTRRSLIARAVDTDQEQLTLLFDDWEAYSGRSFTSFGIGNDNPDNYDRNVRWIASHPWIQVATLDDIAGWGWSAVDRGSQPNLPIDTYDWLRHATELSYDHWFSGSNLEQNFSSIHPVTLSGATTPKAFGELGRAGSILGDTWADVSSLAPSPLRDLGSAVYGVASFETAWHDNTMNDYLSKDASGNYLHPDTTYQSVSGWAVALQSRVGDASLVAAVGRWAASPPAAGSVLVSRADLDQDGEEELVLTSDTAFCVWKTTGARLVLAAARDPATGDADVVVGALLQGPGSNEERDRLEETTGAVRRPPGFVDWWASGGGGSRYVNARFSASQLPNGWRFVSDDGKVTKSVTLSGGRLSVHYDSDPSVGDLYVRFGLAPLPLGLFLGEARLSESRGSSGALTVEADQGSRRATVTLVPLAGSSINDSADFGTDGPRSVVLEREAEVHGSGSHFDVELDLALSN
jgi:hypothetical protein